MFEETGHSTPGSNGSSDNAVESKDQLTFELNIREFSFEERNDDALRFDLPVVNHRR